MPENLEVLDRLMDAVGEAHEMKMRLIRNHLLNIDRLVAELVRQLPSAVQFAGRDNLDEVLERLGSELEAAGDITEGI